MSKPQQIMSGPNEQQQAQDEQEKNLKQSLSQIKHKIVVMSGKGGVGKTSTSVNLAIALSKKGYQVGIMDVDLHGPDVPRMLGLDASPDMNENRKIIPVPYSKTLSAISIESLTPDKDNAIIWRGPIKFSAIRQFIADVAWGDLDFLIIDSPPGTGDEPLTVAQTIPEAKALIVTTPQEISLADVRKSISFCKTVNMEIFGLVENMSGFSCPHCGETIDMFGTGGGEKTALATSIPFLGKIPIDPNVVACGDSGTCYQDSFGDSPVTKAYSDIAEKMASLLSK